LTIAYLGLGANLGEPLLTLRHTIKLLDEHADLSVVAQSHFYESKAVGGPEGQPCYINAAVAVETSLAPQILLSTCLRLETEFGRVRREKWSPRTLDIDMLLYGDSVIDEPLLRVPHPMLRRRLFVLYPLVDIAPSDLKIPPDGAQLGDVLHRALQDPAILADGHVTVV
jgi:2-amino-4-hydroxy-6-hydroxymethyldihydropteridine diphosphokinase